MIINASYETAADFAGAKELALHLAAAENALRAFTGGKVDAILDIDGRPYLLRPAQEHLLEKQRWLDAVIESAADVITVVNRAGTITSESRPVSRVFGYEPDELVGISIFKLVLDEDLPLVHSAFFNVIEGLHEHATARFNHRNRDGSYRTVEATLGKLGTGDSDSVVFTMRPMERPTRTEIGLEEATADLAQSAIPKHRFLAVLAHELRTPLMPVLLGISEMQEDERYAAAAPILEMMRRNIELQTRLIEELTDFTAVGQHKVRLRPEEIDIREAIGFVLEICRGEIAAARIEMKLDLRATDNIVMADSLRLQQVIWNLMRNAIKFSFSGGSISIATSNMAPGTVTVDFIDHGIGIDSEFLSLVFDPYRQAKSADKQKNHSGLGLGMFIAKGLTEAQEGTLFVASEGIGFGTSFRLTLKLASASAMAQPNLPLFELEAPAAGEGEAGS